MKERKGYNGYKVTPAGRKTLLENLDLKFADMFAHHVTHEFGIVEQLPPHVDTVRVVAVAANDRVQAAVVKVNGTTERATDGSTYHITMSLDGSVFAKPVESNDLLADSKVWIAVEPFDVEVVPWWCPFGQQ